MSTTAQSLPLLDHPLGPLASLAVRAQEWRTREARLGTTWAGLWHPALQDEILTIVAQHAQRVDDESMKQLADRGVLPGVRDYTLLWAMLLPALAALEESCCVDNTTEGIQALDNLEISTEDQTDQPDADDENEQAVIMGIPIWYHGVMEQARLTEVRHATHLVRHLDDYHEPTLATLRRQRLRTLRDADPASRTAACHAVAEAFLAKPTRWRDVVETAVHLAAVRACEFSLRQRIRGPGWSTDQLRIKLESGLIALFLRRMHDRADQIYHQFYIRLARLRSAKVVLMYEEHHYLQLTGIRDGRSVRRHLARGLHLIFSNQQHRREDRTAGLWLEQSDEMHQAGVYHFADAVPSAYVTARKQRDYFRLPDAVAVHRYVTMSQKD